MAAKIKTSITLSEDQLNKLDQIVIAERSADPAADIYGSNVIGRLIETKHATLKQIIPIRNGKKITGWMAFYGEHCVGTFDGAASKPQAEQALNSYVWEELSK